MSTPDRPSDPPTRTARTARGPFAYREEGAGPTVLAIHGLPGSGRDFRWLASALGGRVRLVRVDQPGFGATPVRSGTGARLADRVAFVRAAMDALALERVTILGHSMGGPLAMAVAAADPRVDRVALLASVGLHPHRMARRIRRSPDVARLLGVPGVARALAPVMRRGFRRAGFPASTPLGEMVEATRIVYQLSFADHRAAARGLRQPTLLAWARDDRLVEEAIGLSLATELPPGPRLVFEDGGHNIQKTQATELAEALSRFAEGGTE